MLKVLQRSVRSGRLVASKTLTAPTTLPLCNVGRHRGSLQVCMFTTGDVVDVIVSEHKKVKEYWNEYQQPTVGKDRKQMLAWYMIRELSIHAAKEEMVIYPAVREKLGDAVADHAIQEHQQLKELASDLDSMTVDDPKFQPTIEKAVQAFLHHVKEEEGDFYPKFKAAPGVTPEYLEKLKKQYEGAEKIAPSRPHPAAPNKPPANIAANTATVPLDAARDAARFGLASDKAK